MKPFLVSIAILMIAVPVAGAAKFTGQTSQDRRAWVRTEEGVPTQIAIRWRARCDNGATLGRSTEFVPPYKESSSTFVRDGGPYIGQVEDRSGRVYRLEVTVRVRAHRVSSDKWRGRFRATAEVRRNGRFITTCRTGRVRWRATR